MSKVEKRAASVRRVFLKGLIAGLRHKGAGGDPMYFEHCLKTVYNFENIGYPRDMIIPAFIEHVEKALALFASEGLGGSYGYPISLFINDTLDKRKAAAAEYVVKFLTGRSRDVWIDEIKKAEAADYLDWHNSYYRKVS